MITRAEVVEEGVELSCGYCIYAIKPETSEM